jgi:hypothetical protein
MARFHHMWIVEAELEIRNPAAEAQTRCERIFKALERYASDDTDPYPAQAASTDDGWVELTFPVFAPTRFAAVAAGTTVLAEACRDADADVGVVRLTAGEGSEDLLRYRARTQAMEAERARD